MDKKILSNALVDALQGELADINSIFQTLQELEIDNSTINALGYVGETLVEKAMDGFESLCESMTQLFGNIEVLREYHNFKTLRKIEGFEFKASDLFNEVISKYANDNPLHIKIEKTVKCNMSNKTIDILKTKKPSSLSQREEGKTIGSRTFDNDQLKIACM